MGTPEFSAPCLEMLVGKGHNVAAVVTQPDKPVGRKQSAAVFTPVKEAALRLGITNILQLEKVRTREFIDELKVMAPDLIVTIAYGKMLPREVLEIPLLGCINVHGSLLPKYRGAAPIQWAIINGDSVSGVTTMYMDEGMDTGDMLLKKEVEINEDMTYRELYEELETLSAKVLEDTLAKLEKGALIRIAQNSAEASTVPMMKKEMGLIDWSKSAKEIHNLVRGTDPWPGAYTYYKGGRLKIWKTAIFKEKEPVPGEIAYELAENQRMHVPGEIVKITKDGLIAATGDRLLKILQVQFDSGRRMYIGECGHNMDEGEILG
ncbi:MAG: methionyl-tRNA formyltransferase [Ruminiclostridium sp.]|nr:methionyl-tRNA formyltransferase [Ruminiclostridium sp.]